MKKCEGGAFVRRWAGVLACCSDFDAAGLRSRVFGRCFLEACAPNRTRPAKTGGALGAERASASSPRPQGFAGRVPFGPPSVAFDLHCGLRLTLLRRGGSRLELARVTRAARVRALGASCVPTSASRRELGARREAFRDGRPVRRWIMLVRSGGVPVGWCSRWETKHACNASPCSRREVASSAARTTRLALRKVRCAIGERSRRAHVCAA